MARDSVLVIGSGLMGSGIACRSALAGHPTILADANRELAENGRAKAMACIDELLENGLAEDAAAARARELLEISGDALEACGRAAYVIEAITENLEAKQKLFQRLDEALPAEVPILSNTSGLRITEIAAKTKHPERTLTAHFWFPAHLVPLVEVVVGDRSDPALAVKIKELLQGWGKAPVIVKRDLPGQLANRILQAVIREAVNIVEMGLAEPEDVDRAIKMGMGIRFPVWGALEHVDGVGVELCADVQRTVLPEISGAGAPSRLFGQLLERGDLGVKTGKGFYDWSVKSMDELAGRRNRFIMTALRFYGENPE